MRNNYLKYMPDENGSHEMSTLYLDNWEKKYKYSRSQACICRVLGRAGHRGDFSDCLPPRLDHGELWQDRKSGEYVLVSHNYDIGSGAFEDMRDFTDKMGVHCDIGVRSWYYPGSCLRLEWRKD